MTSHITRVSEKVQTPEMVCKTAISDAYLSSVKMQSQFSAIAKQSIESHPMTVLSVQLGEYYIKSILGMLPTTKIRN